MEQGSCRRSSTGSTGARLLGHMLGILAGRPHWCQPFQRAPREPYLRSHQLDLLTSIVDISILRSRSWLPTQRIYWNLCWEFRKWLPTKLSKAPILPIECWGWLFMSSRSSFLPTAAVIPIFHDGDGMRAYLWRLRCALTCSSDCFNVTH